MVLSQVWIILSTTPVLMGDILVVLLFFWCEMCVISHYQNLRDGVDELELAGASGMTLMTAPGHHHSGPMFGGIGANQRRPEAFWSSVMSARYIYLHTLHNSFLSLTCTVRNAKSNLKISLQQ